MARRENSVDGFSLFLVADWRFKLGGAVPYVDPGRLSRCADFPVTLFIGSAPKLAALCHCDTACWLAA